MISTPAIQVKCDGEKPVRCRESVVMTLPLALDGTKQQLRALFLATHPGWLIPEDTLRTYCPTCVQRAREAAHLDRAKAREVSQ